MPLYTTGNLTRFWNQGEQNLCVEHPFLVDRASLIITAGQSLYTLDDSVLSIRRVTWLGMKLDPLPSRNFREVFQSATQIGKPFWYIYNNIGANTIKLFPAPPADIPAGTDLWQNDIATSVIIEFYRMTDNVNFVIPPYLRNQLLKRYTAHLATLMEGAGQSLKESKYYHDTWKKWKDIFATHMGEVFSKPRKYVVNELISSNYFPANPILPISRFGIGVDEGS